MAKKSKTQRAKASAARSARKEAKKAEAAAAELKAAQGEVAEEEAPKKKRFQFFKDVKAEMKRVTWPTRQDVLRWSVVVVAALLFFGVYVAVLDNGIITPILFLISGLGA